MRVLVVGAGPVARSLAASLRRAGVEISTWSRAAGLATTVAPAAPTSDAATVTTEIPATTAILAVSDGAIVEVAGRLLDAGLLQPRPVLLHCAGAISPSLALGAVADRAGGLGLLHPLRALPRSAGESDLAGTVFGVAGDEAGRAAALSLARAVGGIPLLLDEDSLPRYHAAAALASNHTLALLGAAIDLLPDEGLPRDEAARAVAALVRSAADNVAEVGLPSALTGPIARGDVETVERHLAALPPSVLPLYRATGCATVEVARAQGRADPARLRRIASLLGCGKHE